MVGLVVTPAIQCSVGRMPLHPAHGYWFHHLIRRGDLGLGFKPRGAVLLVVHYAKSYRPFELFVNVNYKP